MALGAPSLEPQTIADPCEHRQVGSIFAATGKASLNDPEPSPFEQSGRHVGLKTTSPQWQIPRGVTKGNWDYVRANQVAEDYEQFLDDDPLTKVDWQIIDRYLPPVNNQTELRSSNGSPGTAPLVADFGCGTGRTLAPLLQRGYRGLALDLSLPMLKQFAKRTDSPEGLQSSNRPVLLNANLCELDALKDNSVDHAVCMFSTLGMIAGSNNRSLFLGHARRTIKPGGRFILHAHNVWFQLRSRGGIGWALSNAISSFKGATEFGDRTADYRGLRNFYIHSFRKSELRRALTDHGFDDQTWYGVEPGKTTATENLRLGSSLKLVGWIVVCQ